MSVCSTKYRLDCHTYSQTLGFERQECKVTIAGKEGTYQSNNHNIITNGVYATAAIALILFLCCVGCFTAKKCSNSSSSNQLTTAQTGESAVTDQNNNQPTTVQTGEGATDKTNVANASAV